MLRAINNNIIVRPLLENKLGNGLSITETRGRRDIIRGEVVLQGMAVGELPMEEKDVVWFPLYAADPITFKGSDCLVVKYDDIIMWERNQDE